MNGIPRIPEPWEWVRTKCCPGCGETRPWAQFSPTAYWPDGSVRNVQSRCHLCQRATAAERARARRREKHEQVRAYQNAWKRRRYAELRDERSPNSGVRVDPAPFIAWIDERSTDVGGVVALADMCGVSDRTLRRIRDRDGQDRVGLQTVDRCLTALGEHVGDLYPELVGWASVSRGVREGTAA